jgi:hypothetical protein
LRRPIDSHTGFYWLPVTSSADAVPVGHGRLYVVMSFSFTHTHSLFNYFRYYENQDHRSDGGWAAVDLRKSTSRSLLPSSPKSFLNLKSVYGLMYLALRSLMIPHIS